MEPQGTATNNRTKLNSSPASAQTPTATAHLPTHAPAPEIPPNRPFHTASGHTEQANIGASASYNSADDKLGQHQAPLTEQLQSRLVGEWFFLHKYFLAPFSIDIIPNLNNVQMTVKASVGQA